MTPEQLKASILQRAMEGKLVPQDPTDEPASELLKRIKVEKEKLIADGKIKRDKKETELFRGADGKPYEKLADGTVREVAVPYDIPDSWEWVRLGNIISAKGGKRIPKGYNLQEEDNGHPYLRVTDMKNGTIVPNSIKYAPDTVYEKIKNYTISSNDIYITIAGTIGDIGVVPKKFNNALLTENALKLMLTSSVNKMFLVYLLNSQLVQQQFKVVYNQVAQPKLSIRSTNSTLIPLPPLSEQKRIVEQIERALEKVESYSESYNKLQELDKTFPDKLKKSILQYAMQGKLVPQAPNDEPVEVLLEKIKAEKQKLYEEGKLKKKDLGELVLTKGDDNSPYGKILSWKNSTLNRVTNLYTGNSINATQKQLYFSSGVGINYIATKDVDFNGNITYDNGIKIPDTYLDGFKISQPQSILLCLEGGSAGRKIGMLDQAVCFGNKLCNLSFYSGNNKFLYYFLQSPQFLNDFQENKSGIIGGVSLKNLGNISIPLVPLAEQARISHRVEQLFEKVNQL